MTAMPRFLTLTLGAMLAFAGCSSSENDDSKSSSNKPKEKQPAKTKTKAKTKAKATGLPIAETLSCDRLLPAAVLSKHFPKATMKQHDASKIRAKLGLKGKPRDVRCDLDEPNRPLMLINFKCGFYVDTKSLKDAQKTMGATDVPGLGRTAASIKGQFTVADDDTACIINFVFLGKEPTNLRALAKDLVGTVSPATIGAP